MQRVAIVGSGGAGKTSFATELGMRTGLPVVHLDRIHWSPGWVEPPRDEWAKVVAEQAAGEQWVIDGNYGGTFEIRFERADTVIVLALSRWRCTSRVLWRTLRTTGARFRLWGAPRDWTSSSFGGSGDIRRTAARTLTLYSNSSTAKFASSSCGLPERYESS